MTPPSETMSIPQQLSWMMTFLNCRERLCESPELFADKIIPEAGTCIPKIGFQAGSNKNYCNPIVKISTKLREF